MDLEAVLGPKPGKNYLRTECGTEMAFFITGYVVHIRLGDICKLNTEANDWRLAQTRRCLGSPAKHHVSFHCVVSHHRGRPFLNSFASIMLVVVALHGCPEIQEFVWLSV
jgi:hypothetical protein